MAELHVRRVNTNLSLVIEDPILANNRLFLSGAGHDTTTLAPLFQKHFMNTYQDKFVYNFADQFTTDPNTTYLPMYTEKGTIFCAASDGQTNNDNFPIATYHQSLDPVMLPVRKIWKTVNNRVFLLQCQIQPIYEAHAGAGNYGNLLYNTDITAGSGATQYWTAAGQSQASAICYEDINNNRLWGMACGGGLNSNPVYINSYDSPASTWTYVGTPYPVAALLFFLGVDDLGFIHYVEVQDNNGEFSWYTFFKIHPTTFAVTTVLGRSNRANAARVNPKSWPSNVRRASSTRRVLYSSHFDGNAATGTLVPIRYVFNPVDGSIVATNCTVSYPLSSTYATYAAMFTTTAVCGANNSCSWHIKGHQFTDAGVNYITFWLTDKNAVTGSGISRWDSLLKRTMITYSIGADTGDNVLTYHSSYAFASQADLPKDFMPINSAGTQMMVPATGAMRFMGWNSSTGWNITGTYPYDFTMLGLDQTNRILGTSRERGWGVVHFITPTLPVTIAVVMAATSYTFTGSNISTSCTVEAFGTAGTRIVAAVNLAIDGASMLFTGNSTKNIVVNTSSSAVVTVQLTITGGGINNIIASVDI